MAKSAQQADEVMDPIRKIGPDSTATFDNSSSNPTEWASSEALGVSEEEDDEEDNVDESEDLDPMDKDAPISGADDADLTSVDDDIEEDEEDEDDADEDIDDDMDGDGVKPIPQKV